MSDSDRQRFKYIGDTTGTFWKHTKGFWILLLIVYLVWRYIQAIT